MMPRRAPLPLLAVLGLWLSAVAAVGIGGDFPLNDDWAYAHVVRSLVEGRGFDLLPWTGATLVVQALYGTAVCKLAGFSHEVLRATTLVVSAFGIVAFHALLVELGATVLLAAAGALALALSPLWFNLSFTFMTDVPFAALSVLAMWLYVRAFREGSVRAHLLAGAAAAAAFLIRQHALSIAAAAAITAMLPLERQGQAPPPWSARLRCALAGLAPALIAAAVYAVWAIRSESLPLGLQNKLGEAAGVSMLSMGAVAFRALVTLGFLMAPWAALRPLPARARSWFFASFAVLAAGAAFVFVHEGALMFYLSNLLDDFSVGALTTRDTLFLGWPLRPAGGDALHLALTVVSTLCAAAVIARIAAGLAGSPATAATRLPAAVFCVLALVLLASGTLLQAHYYFDRYLLVPVALAIASIVALAPQSRPGVAFAAALAGLSLYSIAGTHDYLQWNRARWGLLAGLESSGVSARSIDGGFEYNADRLAAELRTAPSDAQARRGQSEDTRSWWWVVDDEWIVAFRHLAGYKEVDSRRWTRWLPPGHGTVLLLHRASAATQPGAEE